ncbi:hypothetical protein N7533_003349, partial [Penicillium manginii]|uniref:uncharacterized protein n=1 Tax=Penicillium manginii TaxID=203109 RepID=UPI0025475DDB
ASISIVHRLDIPFDLTNVPVIENFVGRQDELYHLWQYFNPIDSRSRKVAIIHGLGGMGKTQLAVRFAREHKDDFTAIFWLSGKNRGTLVQSLSSVWPRLPGRLQKSTAINNEELEQRARDVLEWLKQDGNTRWLIIFDNIDQDSRIDSGVQNAYDIEKFFPKADHGSILITSRLPGLIELGRSFPIHKLEKTEAILLLLKNSGLSGSNTVKNLESRPDTLALADRLDGLPLAIVIAAAFMRQTGTSITQYLEYYQQSWSILQSQSSPERQYQRGNMLQTWMISYYEIQDRDPNAAKMLLLLARFDNRDIWYELLKAASKSSAIPDWLEKAISSGLAFKLAVKPLVEFSFLETKQEQGSYAMHPVVQDWCFHVASEDRNVHSTQLSELAIISVGYAVPSSGDSKDLEIQRRLLPHANALCGAQYSADSFFIWGGFHGLGNLYSDQGRLEEAETLYQRALAGKDKVLSTDHASTLCTVLKLGDIYREQGKFQEAERLYQRALAGYEKTLGPDHKSTLDSVNNFGNLFYSQAKLKEAEEMYQQALAGFEKTLGPDHKFTLPTISNLGNLYYDQGKLKEAEVMYQRALAGFRNTLGPDHTSTLKTVNNLGRLYSDQGKLQKAEEMFQRALAGFESTLGPDHTSTLVTVNNLGNLYFDQRKLKNAEKLYQQAMAGYKKTLGLDHTSTLSTVNNLGRLYYEQGMLKEAEEIYLEVFSGCKKALGLDHISTLIAVNNLGLLYKDQGKLEEAEEMYQLGLTGWEKAIGPDHTLTLDIMNRLGLLFTYQGKLKDAEEMFQRALAGYEKAIGPDHDITRQIAERLTTLGISE